MGFRRLILVGVFTGIYVRKLSNHDIVFVGSLTFFEEIKKSCDILGIKKVVNIENL